MAGTSLLSRFRIAAEAGVVHHPGGWYFEQKRVVWRVEGKMGG